MANRLDRTLRSLTAIMIATFGVVGTANAAGGGIVVIGHSSMTSLDVAMLDKVYKGRVIEINGMPVVAVNFNAGNPTRSRFLRSYLNEDEDDYTGYWLVRRYVGKGAPPREISSSAAIINFVRATPGAIAYVEEGDLQPGVTVLMK